MDSRKPAPPAPNPAVRVAAAAAALAVTACFGAAFVFSDFRSDGEAGAAIASSR